MIGLSNNPPPLPNPVADKAIRIPLLIHGPLERECLSPVSEVRNYIHKQKSNQGICILESLEIDYPPNSQSSLCRYHAKLLTRTNQIYHQTDITSKA